MSGPEAFLDLYDFRRRVAAMYADRRQRLQDGRAPAEVLDTFRAERNQLFAEHPQSALDTAARRRFSGLDYFPYNDAARVPATIEPAGASRRLVVGTSGEGDMPMELVGTIRFEYGNRPASLALYWIDVYGGSLFLPFRDATAPAETYGGGRYLFDTVKGSDFDLQESGADRLRIVLDFNYAYNPSCAYNPRWACPLAPPANHLSFAVDAGERKFT